MVSVMEAKARGGTVRVLCRSGGLGDVLWAAAASEIAAKQRPKDVVLFLTQPAMIQAAKLAAPRRHIIATHLPGEVMQSVLRRFVQVVDLNYEARDGQGQHMLLAYLEQLGCKAVPPPTTWHFTPARDPRITTPTACIYAGPSWAVRELPAETWAQVVSRMQSEVGLRVLQVLPSAEAGPQIAGCDGQIIGEPLSGLCNLFDQCAVVITIDSVMLHLAAGTRVPMVGLFGPTKAACRLFPSANQQAVEAVIECAGCHHRQPRLHWQSGCPFEIACMKSLSADTILKAVTRVMSAAPRAA